jgi:hypothetical protein
VGWKRGSNWWFVCWWAAPRSVRASGAPHHVLLPESGFSDQDADDLVEGLGLAGLVVQALPPIPYLGKEVEYFHMWPTARPRGLSR